MGIALTARAMRTPYGIHLHGADYRNFVEHVHPALRPLLGRFFFHAEYVTVLGETWATYVCETFGLPRSAVKVVPNGVKAVSAAVRHDRNPRRVVFLGRIERLKGVSELLAAVETLLSQGLDFRLSMAGTPADEKMVTALKEAAEGTGGTINYLGEVDREAASQLLGQADIFCLPSHAEGLPMSLLEAMSVGLACVVTDVGAVSEVVTDKHDALVIPAGDVQALTVALRAVLEDPSLRESLGSNAHNTWQGGFSGEAMARGHVAVWRAATA
jgi:glycosyltransferase involved in cell wall biosynthesis